MSNSIRNAYFQQETAYLCDKPLNMHHNVFVKLSRAGKSNAGEQESIVEFTFADFMASFVIIAIFALEMGGLKLRMDFNCGHT